MSDPRDTENTENADNTERLARGLHDEADRFGLDAPIGLDDVRASARSIRRRRRLTVAAVAAATVVIAVPVAVAAGGVDRADNPVPPATSSPSPTPSAVTPTTPSQSPSSPTPTTPSPSSPTATSQQPHRTVTLSADTTQHGGEPRIPYVFDGAIVKPDGSTVPLSVDLDEVAPLGDGWVGRGMDNDGAPVVTFLDPSGKVTSRVPSEGDLAVSDDGTLVSYATRTGKLMVVWDGATSPAQLRTEGRSGEISPVAVEGSKRCDNPEGVGGCVVYYNQTNVDGSVSAKLSDRHGIVDAAGPFSSIGGVSRDGLRAGVVSVGETGSCSAVITSRGVQLWKTCDYTLGRFSPDGRYVIGRPSYLDGLGDGLVAVLDARNGTVLVEYDTKRDSFVNGSAWDTDGTLLTMLYDKGWALMRLTPTGDVSSVSTGRIAGTQESVPVHFSTRP